MSDAPKRQNQGKPQYSLLSQMDFEPCVRALENGAVKYGRGTYRNCIKEEKQGYTREEIIDSLERHLAAFKDGEDYDPDSGNHHICGIQANAMFLGHWLRTMTDLPVSIAGDATIEPANGYAIKTMTEDEAKRIRAILEANKRFVPNE